MPKGVPNPKPEEAALKEHEVLFLQSLREFLPALKLHSDEMLIRKIGIDKLEDVSLEFYSFVTEGAGSLTNNEFKALANQMWKCISIYISRVGTPVALNTLINHVQFIDSAANEQFPGYAASHLLKHAIMSHVSA